MRHNFERDSTFRTKDIHYLIKVRLKSIVYLGAFNFGLNGPPLQVFEAMVLAQRDRSVNPRLESLGGNLLLIESQMPSVRIKHELLQLKGS